MGGARVAGGVGAGIAAADGGAATLPRDLAGGADTPDGPEQVPATKERRLRYPLLWLLFLGCLVAGAALLMRPEGSYQWLGIALLCAPLIAMGVLSLGYYLLERARASR